MTNKITGQVTKFSIVGLVNTAIDFLVTNFLYSIFSPLSLSGLTLISIIACLVAASNSYLFNSKWTFNEHSNSSGQKQRFLLVTFIGMAVNTAVFLFISKYLALMVDLDDLLIINIAKLSGVSAAMGITFIGYKFGVFYSDSIKEFKESYVFLVDTNITSKNIIFLLLIGLIARLTYLYLAPVVYGDAVNYSWDAFYISIRSWPSVDVFWHSLFVYWQALFLFLGLDRYSALVVSSLIPGLFLLVPVYLLTAQIYGRKVALIAGSFLAIHPRMIEYSVNGYEESFYLLGILSLIYALQSIAIRSKSNISNILLALGLASSFLVRNESILLIILMFLVSMPLFYSDRRKSLLAPIMAGLSLVGLFILLNMVLFDSLALFAKASNIYKPFAETLDYAAAAKATYAIDTHNSSRHIGDVLMTLVQRWPSNMLYIAERLPGVLLSPIIFFALLLPLITVKSSRNSSTVLIVLFTLWPIVFYPFIQLEPRMLLPFLIGVSIFGAAGLVSFSDFFNKNFNKLSLPFTSLALFTSLLFVILLPLVFVLAWNSEQSRGYHRTIGGWISTNLSGINNIVGDGYGYISSSTFWADVKGQPRVWTESPLLLEKHITQQGASVIVFYEKYLKQANPELLNVLDDGLPSMVLLKEFEFDRVGRVQIWGVEALTSRLK